MSVRRRRREDEVVRSVDGRDELRIVFRELLRGPTGELEVVRDHLRPVPTQSVDELGVHGPAERRTHTEIVE